MEYDGHSELLKAAPKRLADAWELIEKPTREPQRSDAAYRHLCGAYYLAGYAVECVLKTYIILLLNEREAKHIARWLDVINHFGESGSSVDLTGRHSHDLGRLLMVAELAPAVDSDPHMKATWGRCIKWDYSARYRPDYMLDRERVGAFVEACESVYHWLRSRLPFA